MAGSRDILAENLLRLKDNAHWRHYVGTLRALRDQTVRQLLNSDHPDEGLRGEARAYEKLLRAIDINHGTPSP